MVPRCQALIAEIEELNDGYISKDGKLVIDFLQAIHAAEKRQAELDYRVFSDEMRALKVIDYCLSYIFQCLLLLWNATIYIY